MPNQAGIDAHNGQEGKKIAAGYEAINFRDVKPEIYAYAEQAAHAGKMLNVLDIGSGAGNDAIEMAQIGHRVVGVEPSELRLIAKRERSHPFIQYRDGKLPALDTVKPGETFDIVILSAVLQYIDPEERVESLVRIAQLMRRKAKLVLLYPSPPSRAHQFEISVEDLKADITAANARLPAGKKLFFEGEPKVNPDIRGRKSLDGRDLFFYKLMLSNGRERAAGAAR